MGEVESQFRLLTHHIVEDYITPIGWQAHEIIASILEDPSPDLAEVKERLARCLAEHPGSPELALLAHLMQTSELANAEYK